MFTGRIYFVKEETDLTIPSEVLRNAISTPDDPIVWHRCAKGVEVSLTRADLKKSDCRIESTRSGGKVIIRHGTEQAIGLILRS
jgi:hypothetical protein